MPAPADPATLRTGAGQRRGRLRLPLLLSIAGAVLASPVLAQEPPAPTPPDTIPSDTVRVPIPPEEMVTDTLPRDTLRTGVPDTLRPPPHLPRYPETGRAAWAEARWEWTREDLQQYHGLSLLELLERVPGLTATRAGGPGAPAGAAALGQGGGRLRVFRDGLEMDPLNASTLDLQQLGLIDLDLVRVERSLVETRIHLRTFQLEDQRPLSDIEIGTGNFQARFLRAMFSRPAFGHSVVTAAFDLSNAGGYRFVEPSSFTSARVRWDHALGDRSGVQLEYRLAGVSRENEPYPADFDRSELVLRARSEPRPGLHIEALLGRISHDPAAAEDPAPGQPDPGEAATNVWDIPLSSTQMGARALFQRGAGWLEVGGRARLGGARGFSAAASELHSRGGLQPVGWLGAEAEVRTTSVAAGRATEGHATVRTGPVLGLTFFGSASMGERWLTLREDLQRVVIDTVLVDGEPEERTRTVLDPRFTQLRAEVGGLRVGGEWAAGPTRLGVALVSSAPSTSVPFAQGFDRGTPAVEVGRAEGVEGFGSLALPGRLRNLTLEGWYTHWMDRGMRPYLPDREAMLAAVFTGLFREEQFEPHLRLEATHRGASLVPETSGESMVPVDPYTMLNFSLQLRIIDLRAFFIYENILNELEAVQVPGRFLPSARTIYGVRWFFRN